MNAPLPPPTAPLVTPVFPGLERARGNARLTVRLTAAGQTVVQDLGQAGCSRLLFPARDRRLGLEAVLVNTGGGMTGGDRLSASFGVGAGSDLTVTTQASEKIYRSDGALARSAVSLSVGPGARADWIPQETILFDGARLSRSLSADVATDGHLLLVESLVFGRAAMGETLSSGLFRDRWRIRRGGRLVFAEDLRLDEPMGPRLAAKAGFAGAGAAATILLVSPKAATFLDAARFLLSTAEVEAGVSRFDGMITARILAPDSISLRAGLMPLIALLSGRDLPRIWVT